MRATEAALKAVIWKKEKWAKWPMRTGGFKYLYAHNYDALLDATGLRIRLRANSDLWASWQTLANAVQRQYRYSPVVPTIKETHEVAKSARALDIGVARWLLKIYQEMT